MTPSEYDIPSPRMKPQKGVGYVPRPEQEMPPHDEIMATLSKFQRDPKRERPSRAQQAPPVAATDTKPVSLRDARLKADALILRRGGKLPRNREQYVSKAWTEREEAS